MIINLIALFFLIGGFISFFVWNRSVSSAMVLVGVALYFIAKRITPSQA